MTDEATRSDLPITNTGLRERLSQLSRRVQHWRRDRWLRVPALKNGLAWRNLSGERVRVYTHSIAGFPSGKWTCHINSRYGHVYGPPANPRSDTPLNAALTSAHLWMECRIPQQTDLGGRPIVPIRDGQPVRDIRAETHLCLDGRKDIKKVLEMIGKREEVARDREELAWTKKHYL